jgi:hypothetical protein
MRWILVDITHHGQTLRPVSFESCAVLEGRRTRLPDNMKWDM